MVSRKESVDSRKSAVQSTLDKIIGQRALRRDVRNLDGLAKKVMSLCDVKIGYSTLLKKEQPYRGLLERALVKILPTPEPIFSSQLKAGAPAPDDWMREKLSYESQIGMLKRELGNRNNQLKHLEIAIAQSSPGANASLMLANTNDASSTNKLCLAFAQLLDFCAKEKLGIELNSAKREVKGVYGEVIVQSNLLEPYFSWQKKNKPEGGGQ